MQVQLSGSNTRNWSGAAGICPGQSLQLMPSTSLMFSLSGGLTFENRALFQDLRGDTAEFV